MDCSEAKPHLETYADGELDPALHTAVESHVTGCPECGAVVERWRALRQCVSRALGAMTAPAGLTDRVRAGLAGERLAGRRRMLIVTPLAAAAVLLLAVFLWLDRPTKTTPQTTPLATVQLTPAAFAGIYRYCAIDHNHDALGVCNACPVETKAKFDHDLATGPVLMPNLAELGFQLAGACECSPARRAAASLHAFYRRAGDNPATVSFFSMDHPVELTPASPLDRESHHEYMQGRDENVLVIQWNRDDHAYAVCGALPDDELRDLAERVDVAARTQPNLSLASASASGR